MGGGGVQGPKVSEVTVCIVKRSLITMETRRPMLLATSVPVKLDPRFLRAVGIAIVSLPRKVQLLDEVAAGPVAGFGVLSPPPPLVLCFE